MSVNTTIDNSCPRCKANQPLLAKQGKKRFIVCSVCDWKFELIGTETTLSSEEKP